MVSSGLYSKTYYTILQLMSLEMNSISIEMQNYKMTLRLYTHLTESWKVTKENTQDNKKQLQKESFKVTVHTLKMSVLDNTFIKSGTTNPGVFTGLQNFLGLTVLQSRKQLSRRAQRASGRQTDRQTHCGAQRQNAVV